MILIAHNIRSAYNVGALFRTADGMGCTKIYLTGYTPCPHDGNRLYVTAAEKMIAKTALGAEKMIAWQKSRTINPVLQALRTQGISLVALEQSKRSVAYHTFHPRFPLALIVGNEPRGIHWRILQKCDVVVDIPMRGKKNSLNVAVAFGVAGYHFMTQYE